MPIFCQWVEHQYDLDPPSEFILTSIKTDIVHYLSGLMNATLKLLSASVLFHIHLATLKISLVRVSIRVRNSRLTPWYFHYFTFYMKLFHLSLALLLCYRCLTIFSFRSYYLPFTLHYQTALLSKSLLASGDYHPFLSCFPTGLCESHYN